MKQIFIAILFIVVACVYSTDCVQARETTKQPVANIIETTNDRKFEKTEEVDSEINQNNKIISDVEVNITKKDPKLIKIKEYKTINQKQYAQKISSDDKKHLKYKKIMDENYYNLYLIFERILRANNLYYQNWRLVIKPEAEDINAYASSANMIVIYSSLYDSLYNNKDALAFIISHELSHFLLGHHQISLENNNKIKQMEANVANMKYEAEKQNGLASINNAVGNYYNAMGNSLSSLAYSISVAATNSTINKIYTQERALEFDADAEAISIMAKSGFDAHHANDALEFLSNLPNIYTNRSSHPPINERVSNIDYTIQISDITELKNEGAQNIYNSKVLEAKKSSDNKTIVILKPSGNTKATYIPESKENKLIQKAYKYYINNDFLMAKSCFQDAYSINSSNYIPALYLSYINEYEYHYNHDKKSLKLAASWAKRANKLKPSDKNTTKQRQYIISEFKNIKKRKGQIH